MRLMQALSGISGIKNRIATESDAIALAQQTGDYSNLPFATLNRLYEEDQAAITAAQNSAPPPGYASLVDGVGYLDESGNPVEGVYIDSDGMARYSTAPASPTPRISSELLQQKYTEGRANGTVENLGIFGDKEGAWDQFTGATVDRLPVVGNMNLGEYIGAANPIIGAPASAARTLGVDDKNINNLASGFDTAAPYYAAAGAAALGGAALGGTGVFAPATVDPLTASILASGASGAAGVEATGLSTLAGAGAGAGTAGALSGLAVPAAIVGTGLVGAGASLYGADVAADAASDAANTAAGASDRATDASLQAQREQLAYLKDVDKLPREYREAALTKLNSIYNAPGGFQYPQEQMIASAQSSPLYDAIMGGQKAGEDAILRNQAMTGGFRSGNMQSNLNEFSTGLKNSAMLTAYDEQKQNYNMGLTGLAGLANLPSNTSSISNVMGNMGQTSATGIMNSGNIMAQGITAGGQAYQGGLQGLSNAIGSTTGNLLYAKGKGIL